LRAAVADFVGRKEEIKVLVDGLSGGGQVGISGVNGMGDIGKTELALVTANQIKEVFPDGQILIDMEGRSERPLAPAKALATCIRAFAGLDSDLSNDTNDLRASYLIPTNRHIPRLI
jgi:hypothetical protein